MMGIGAPGELAQVEVAWVGGLDPQLSDHVDWVKGGLHSDRIQRGSYSR